ncbi:MAG: hypothetical protein ACLQVI_05040 [Polyangiaceae bacterium]|jgi:hypothetical protein
MVSIDLAPGAEDNGLASMLADLVRQNLEAKPHKIPDFDALDGTIAIVAEDADVCLTLRFQRGRLTIHDGIVGVPDLAIRGTSDMIMAMSNMPLTRPLGLPIPDPRDKEQVALSQSVMTAMRAGELKMYGALLHPGLVMRLTRVMSVNG